MSTTCRRIQDTLAIEGAQALRDDETAQQHVANCDDCFAVLERLNELDETFGTLPTLDASDEVVEQLMARRRSAAAGVSGASSSAGSGLAWFRWEARPALRWALPATGAAVAVVAVLVLPRQSLVPDSPASVEVQTELEARLEADQRTRSDRERGGYFDNDALPAAEPEEAQNSAEIPAVFGGGQERVGELSELPATAGQSVSVNRRLGDRNTEDGADEAEGLASGYAVATDGREQDNKDQGKTSSSPSSEFRFGDDLRSNSELPAREHADDVEFYRDKNVPADGPEVKRDIVAGVGGVRGADPYSSGAHVVLVGGNIAIAPPERVAYVAPELPAGAKNEEADAVVILELQIDVNGEVTDARVVQSVPELDSAAIDAAMQWRYQPTVVDGVAVPIVMTVPVEFTTDGSPDAHARPVEAPGVSQIAADTFIRERAQVERLSFQPARGYWANTYVPGDPVLRGLGRALTSQPSAPAAGMPVALHHASHRVDQPFDRPVDSAIAVYMASDQAATEGPRRALVQIGLQAASKHAGHRVAMHLAIVADLRGPVTRVSIGQMRAVLEAFAAARGSADRFTLIAAGGDLVLSADEFRYGAINVALRDLLEAGPPPSSTRDLESALRLAVRTVSAESTSLLTPGAGAVVLVTSQPFGSSTDGVERIASRCAAAGMPVSVIGLGDNHDDHDLEAIDRIVLAGQGNRRFLRTGSGSTEAARALVDRELSASSRVVARALRLRIRLAPGVKLVDVVGSRRLGTSDTARVRETERRLDRELARSLGIEADRGDDEDGIQIVIPGFHADDSHVFVLDVVVPGPGPLADVTVRYKDLVYLRNGVARATTALARGERGAGPIEANVLKNFLAYRLSESFAESARLLSRNEPTAALDTLVETRQLLVGLRGEMPGLANDGDLAGDISLLQQYETLLVAHATREDLPYWSRSMYYAGLLKVLPRPLIS